MTTVNISLRFRVRRRTAANWVSTNEVLLSSEIGLESDTGKFKYGDGVTAWNSQRYADPSLFAVAAGTDTITATFASKPVLYDGFQLRVRAAGANTGAATFNPNALGALPITKFGGTALTAGDISAAGHELVLRYRSSVPRWELLNPATSAAPATYSRTTVTAATSNQTATNGIVVVLCDCTANPITVNLPTAVGNTAMYVIKKIDASANAATIDGNASETIDGSTTAAISIRYESRTLVSDGSNWHVV